MRRTKQPPPEERVIHCHKLGHLVSFSYCRSEQGDMPCQRIVCCWYDSFLVEDYLRDELGPEEWEAMFRPPSGHKLSQLLELIMDARLIRRRDTLIPQQPQSQDRQGT